ncbi:MAG: LacI family DNA-binding transcriptional regulator [Candidatus Marinimicrobia bacterium]|nr:LacI family DNA-binding transcriptional regulator [Candidatus Neomarinimicrobiota bacterium]
MGNSDTIAANKINKITLNDIADKTGVSAMTVSRVVSGKGIVAESTRNKILNAVEQMDYIPNLIARILSSQRTMTIGVIIPKTKQVFLDNYIAQILSGVMTVVKQQDYRLMIYPVEEHEKSSNLYLDIARSKLLDGLIMLKPKINDLNLESLIDSGFPAVLINHRTADQRVNFIDTRNVEGAEIAVNYLFEKGCRHIAFISGSKEESNGIDRLKGYEEAMSRLGLTLNPNWVIDANFDAGRAYQAVDNLLNGQTIPDAIFCADDYMAIAVMERIIERELSVPDDIAVIGFNNIDIAKFTRPALTTIKQPLMMIGKLAAENLIDLIEHVQEPPIQKFLDLQLIVRESA